MLSKFSVKRPFTVLVGVVAIIVLGVVSLMRMTADLLPNMTFPYVIIITTDVGASPEEVEMGVTAPIEASMATTSNIKNLRSMSYNSYSMVILEYEQAANMDSTLIEIQQNLDQLKGAFSDSVGTPIVMQIDPDMLPIMMAAVDVDDMDSIEAGHYIDNEIVPQLESIEGVASVSATGGIEEKIEVTLNEDKINAINEKITAEIDKKFVDAQAEMDDAKVKIEDGKNSLNDGQEQLAEQISVTKNDLDSKKIELYQTEQMLNEQLVELQAQGKDLEGAIAGLQAAYDGGVQLQEAITGLEQVLGLVDMGMLNDEMFLQAAGMDVATARATYEGLKAQMDALNAGLVEQGAAFSDFGITITSYLDLPEAIAALTEGLAQINLGIETIKSALEQVAEGKAGIDEALVMLNKSEILGAIEMGSAKSQLASGESALKDAQTTFDDAKDQAYSSADLTNIVTVDMVKNLLLAQNFEMPAGYITEDGVQYLVKVGNKVNDIDTLTDVVLLDLGMDNIDTIKLSDVADVVLVDNSADVYAKINGNPGILITFEKQTGYSTGDVTDTILERFEQIESEYDNVHLSVLMDQGLYIDIIVDSVVKDMIFGAILAILVLIIFLKDLRPTIIIACAIPLSVVFAIVLMYFSNITLNIISMSGLALGIGMLVDNSIVVIENIYRLKNSGMPIKKSSIYGASQVTGAIVASTLTTVCVFAPIVFTDGITRQLFVDMALTIAYTLCASLVIALTLVPAMSAGLLKNAKATKQAVLDKFLNWYGKVLTKLIKFKPIVFILVLALLIASIGAALSRGTAFMPAMTTSTQITLSVTAKEDQTLTFEELCERSDEVVEQLMTIEEIDTIGAMMGGGSTVSLMGGNSDEAATMYIILKEGVAITTDEINQKIMDATKDCDCLVEISTSMMDMSALSGSGISISIKGRNIETLQNIAADLTGILEDVEGIDEISNGLDDLTNELVVSVDKEKAAEYNLTVAQVFQLVYAKMASTTSATTISTDIKDYNVYVQSQDQKEATLDDIRKLTFTYTNKDNEEEEIPLSEIVEFKDKAELSTIRRSNQNRYISVSATLKEGYNVGLVGNDVRQALEKYECPEGYTLEMAGEDETINEAMKQLLLMLLLAVILIYLIMVAQFQSLLSPFIIMFTIPLAFTGGFLALYFTGSEVSVIAMVGFVMLAGIIVNNGIVMVDYINQLRREGMAKKDAIVEAAKTRLRPVLMTALTTIISMSTMALGIGEGTEMMQPMAIVAVGGLVYGTLLTLIVVPCLYDAFNREKNMVEEDTELSEEELAVLNEGVAVEEDI